MIPHDDSEKANWGHPISLGAFVCVRVAGKERRTPNRERKGRKGRSNRVLPSPFMQSPAFRTLGEVFRLVRYMKGTIVAAPTLFRLLVLT